jgi:hypothetical protein
MFERLRQFPFENILLDVVLTLLFFSLSSADGFFAGVLPYSLWILAPLQVVTLYFAFEGKSDGVGELRPGRLRNLLGMLASLNTILAVGGFLWLLYLAAAIDRLSGSYPYWQTRFAFIVALFGGILAYGISIDADVTESRKFSRRFLAAFVAGLYLFLTEAFIRFATSGGGRDLFLLLVVMFLSYVPVRLSLVFWAPFSIYDLLSAIFFFGVFVYEVAAVR